ncbi:hypothetical protein PR048_026161 [Dryococelus australis]|uniref:Transposase n=1 Tax=Dryococelus australis TaxID=614101 RepID=A0ABQ9GKJ4_9NEOP|nr:hypothetical protein PR048_026161 [Dryococelus australis]
MARDYKKKENPYTEEDILKAVEIKNVTRRLQEAAIFCKIDKSLLSRSILGKNTGQLMAKWGFALMKTDVLNVVAEFAPENEIKVPFKNDVPEGIGKLSLEDKPGHIWNLDETGFSRDPHRKCSKERTESVQKYSRFRKRKHKCIGMCFCSRTSSAPIGYIFVSKLGDAVEG